MALLPESLELQVVTPAHLIVHEHVEEVQVPARGGYLGVLPGHAPLLSELQAGELSFRQGKEWTCLAVFWGFVEVLPAKVVVLAEVSERAEDIDVERARAASKRAEQRLSSHDPDIDIARAQAALQRALVRLQVAGRSGALAPGGRSEHGGH